MAAGPPLDAAAAEEEEDDFGVGAAPRHGDAAVPVARDLGRAPDDPGRDRSEAEGVRPAVLDDVPGAGDLSGQPAGREWYDLRGH